MDNIVLENLRQAIIDAQERRAEAERDLDRLRKCEMVDPAEMEDAFRRRDKAISDLNDLQRAYETLGGDPDVDFS